jgi:hypothetical protein
MDLWIYAIVIILSIVLFILGFINIKETWGMILMFVGLAIMGIFGLVSLYDSKKG